MAVTPCWGPLRRFSIRDAVGLEDSFDFNGGDKYGWLTNQALAAVRHSRSVNCGTSGDLRIAGGTGR